MTGSVIARRDSRMLNGRCADEAHFALFRVRVRFWYGWLNRRCSGALLVRRVCYGRLALV